jgi:murein DD-endopeptidase
MLTRMALRMGVAMLLVGPRADAQLSDRPLLIEARIPKPPTVVRFSDGRALVYEVHVTNFEPRELTWIGLQATDAATGAPLYALADTALWRDLVRPGATGTQITMENRSRLGGGQRALVYVFAMLPDGVSPASLRHSLTLSDSGGTRTLQLPAVPVAARAVTIGPPLKGGTWLAANGPARTSGHRRALIPVAGTPAIAQRFAIDYVMIDSGSSTFRGDRLVNANYYAQGAEAIAVADGIVVATKDSIPENVPGITSRAVPITLETVGGNHVILDIGGGSYAFYAHLQPGSLRVKLGDRVRRGAVLGLVGNSGNSTEPHLHFHIADGNSPLGAEGVPYVHETLEIVGRCASLMGGCKTEAPQTLRGIMPQANELVRFPR